LTFNDVKFHFFLVAQTSQVFFRVVLCNRRLMNKNVFVGIQTVNKTVTVLYIEPFDLALYASGQNFLLHLFFAFIGTSVFLIFFSFGHCSG